VQYFQSYYKINQLESWFLMKNQKIPVISFVFYILAILMLGYSVWALIYSSRVVSEAVSFGQLVVKGSEFEVLSFYMNNVSLYLFFALVLFALGWIIQLITPQELDELEVELPDEELEEVVLIETED